MKANTQSRTVPSHMYFHESYGDKILILLLF